jgi:hypothetical protein
MIYLPVGNIITPALADNAAGGTGGLQRFFRRKQAVDTNDGTYDNQANDEAAAAVLLERVIRFGRLPEEEAVVQDQLTDRFPQVSLIDPQIILDCHRV